MPRAIMASMVVVTGLCILVAVTAVGARQWEWFEGAEAPLVQIMREITGRAWIVFLFATSSAVAIVSVVLTVLYGQTRILLSLSRDGMAPKIFGRIHPANGTPVAGTFIVGGAVTLTAALIPLGELTIATSIGTLFAYGLVDLAVIHLRRRSPHMPRTFRVPFFPLTPSWRDHLPRLQPPALEGGRPERDRVPGADPHRREPRRSPRARAGRTRSPNP